MYKSSDNKEFKTKKDLIEYEKNNGLTKDDVIANLYFEGIRPICKCGCNKKAKYNRSKKNFNDYLQGHNFSVMISPTIGTKGTELAKNRLKNAHKVLAEKRLNGTYKNWNTGQTAETNESIKKVADSQRNIPRNDDIKEKISIARKNFIKKLKESGNYASYNQHLKEYWKDPKHREEQKYRTTNRLIKDNYSGKTSKTEELTKIILDDIGIKYIHQIAIEGKIFDFLINEKTILEIDGYFYHADPRVFINGPIYPIQINTVKNDIIKNEILERLNYKLIRIWDTDILLPKTFEILNKLKEDQN